jgi:hypothetical protein
LVRRFIDEPSGGFRLSIDMYPTGEPQPAEESK